MKLLITGGQQRRRRALTDGSGRWYKYVIGHVMEVDDATRSPKIVFKQKISHNSA